MKIKSFTEAEKDMFKRVILRYQKRNPKEWRDWVQLRDQMRSEMKDGKFGTNESDSMRHVANIPVTLDTLLRNTSMLIMDRPDYLGTAFLKAFPVFKLVDKL